MIHITVEPPPPMHDLQELPAPRETEAPTHARPSSGRPLDEQAAMFLWSVARLPFKVLAHGDRFYVEYAKPFAVSMLSRGTLGQVAAMRMAACRECPHYEIKSRSKWASFQIGVGAMLWGMATWWLIGPWLWAGGVAWSGFALIRGDGPPAEFCGQCRCGTHGMARLQFKVKRRGSRCPIGLWEKTDGKCGMDRGD